MHCISFKFLVPIMTGGLEKKKKNRKRIIKEKLLLRIAIPQFKK